MTKWEAVIVSWSLQDFVHKSTGLVLLKGPVRLLKRGRHQASQWGTQLSIKSTPHMSIDYIDY